MTTRVGVAIANADALDVLQPRTNTGDGQTNTPSQTMHDAVVGFMLLFIGFGFAFFCLLSTNEKHLHAHRFESNKSSHVDHNTHVNS